MEIENASNPLVVGLIITWIIEFYLFGMQRASLRISRHNSVQWRGVSDQLLPSWYPITWVVRIAKYVILIAIFFVIGWKFTVGLLFTSFVLSTFLPIPYRFLYKSIFRNKVAKIKALDTEAGQFYSKMLDSTDF